MNGAHNAQHCQRCQTRALQNGHYFHRIFQLQNKGLPISLRSAVSLACSGSEIVWKDQMRSGRGKNREETPFASLFPRPFALFFPIPTI